MSKSSLNSKIDLKSIENDLKQMIKNILIQNDSLIRALVDQLTNVLLNNEAFNSQIQETVNNIVNDKVKQKDIDINPLKEQIENVQKGTKTHEQEINILKDQLDAAEQHSRRNCVVIHGIDSNKDKNTDVTARNFFYKYLDLDITQEEIDRSHRLPTHGNPLIVKFVWHNIKAKVYASKRKLKGKGYIITESLTKKRLKCVKLLKKLRDDKCLYSYWTIEGKIYYTKIRNGKSYHLNSFDEQEIYKLFSK